jgi:hypothetical protein
MQGLRLKRDKEPVEMFVIDFRPETVASAPEWGQLRRAAPVRRGPVLGRLPQNGRGGYTAID